MAISVVMRETVAAIVVFKEAQLICCTSFRRRCVFLYRRVSVGDRICVSQCASLLGDIVDEEPVRRARIIADRTTPRPPSWAPKRNPVEVDVMKNSKFNVFFWREANLSFFSSSFFWCEGVAQNKKIGHAQKYIPLILKLSIKFR